ncbi:sensor histidine kinase [Companilactobacillus insicii]|uniref:sensor histidine kinase n=1 Tax=Companilactobacillus insicii TaxID=1732567 RepID=UPI001B886ABF|nr:GHKL domain-containing protein [Companilactobacillus insicii]
MIYIQTNLSPLGNVFILFATLQLAHFFMHDFKYYYWISDLIMSTIFGIIGLYTNNSFILFFVLALLGIHIFKSNPHQINYNNGISIVMAANIQLTLFSLSTFLASFIIYFQNNTWTTEAMKRYQNVFAPMTLIINFILLCICVTIINHYEVKIQRVRKNIVRYQLGKRIFIMLFTLLLAFMVILIISDIEEVSPLIQMGILLIFTILSISTYWQSIIFIQSFTMRKEASETAERIKELDDYLTSSQQQNEDLRKFKHDFQNIMLSLGQVVDDQSSDEIKRYYHELMDQQNSFENIQTHSLSELQSIKSKPIQSLLTQKYFMAKSKGIHLNFELTNNDYEIKKNDLSIIRIIGILLDNAIEYVQGIENKVITCALINSSGTLEITIDNSIKNNIDLNKIFQSGYSTKTHHRGYGLANIKNITDSSDELFIDTQIIHNHLMITLIVLQDEEH